MTYLLFFFSIIQTPVSLRPGVDVIQLDHSGGKNKPIQDGGVLAPLGSPLCYFSSHDDG